jgi:uncharacterized Zn-binding protein involved in type VI secretion
MRALAAKAGDTVTALDTHLIQPPTGGPVPVPHPFSGVLETGLSEDVRIQGRWAAIVGSTAVNRPPHAPIGGTFTNPPANRGRVTTGSSSVSINGKAAAYGGRPTVTTCGDPDREIGTIAAGGTVRVGGAA